MNHKGLTLLEVLIAGVVFSIVALITGKVVQFIQNQALLSEKRTLAMLSIGAVSTSLQKQNPKSIQYIGFTGKSTGPPTARMLIPRPSTCAGLEEDDSCKQDTALIYVHANPATTPSVTAICAINDALVFDITNTTYGAASVLPGMDGFEITSGPGQGKLLFEFPNLLALLDLPVASLFYAVSKLSQFTVTYNNGVFSGSVNDAAFNADCAENVKASRKVNGLPTTFYTLTTAPYILAEFLGPPDNQGQPVSPKDITKARGKYPLQVYTIQVRTVGRQMAGKPNAGEIVSYRCHIDPNLFQKVHRLICDFDGGIGFPNATRFRVKATFKNGLGSASEKKFEIVDDSNKMLPSENCLPGNPICKPLPVTKPLQVSINGTETYFNLDPYKYSLMKALFFEQLTLEIKEASGKIHNVVLQTP